MRSVIAIFIFVLLHSYMIVTHDTLINSWNFRGLDGSSVWHGNEHVRNIR